MNEKLSEKEARFLEKARQGLLASEEHLDAGTLSRLREARVRAVIRAEILDGDTPAHRRAQLKADPPHILISNPDLLHLSLLPHHGAWKPFWEQLLELRKNCRGRARRKAADGLLNYVSDRREMIRYPEFLSRGWQIGSGPTESECRLLPDRLKGAGMRWDADNAEAVMALEAMRISGQSDAYWEMCLVCSN